MTTDTPREVIARALREWLGGSGYEPFADAILSALRENWAIVPREALQDIHDTIALVEHPAFPDPDYHEEVKALGERIGFGALMSTAEAGWREVLEEQDCPTGGEFVSGPCRKMINDMLTSLRAMIAKGGV